MGSRPEVGDGAAVTNLESKGKRPSGLGPGSASGTRGGHRGLRHRKA